MDVRLPKIGDTADSGVVVSILVKPGDVITAGQTILEVENEKAIAPIPAPAAGKVAEVRVKEGDKVNVGAVLLTLEGSAGSVPAAASGAQPTKPAPAKSGTRPAAPRPVEAEPEPAEDLVLEEDEPEDDAYPPPPAAPLVRQVARELGINLRRITGSQSGGRIVMADLRAYIQRLKAQAARGAKGTAPASAKAQPSAAQASIDFSQWGPVTKKPLSSLRQVIARRMVESTVTIPHVTQFDEADLTRIEALRAQFKADYDKSGVKLTPTPFLLKALAATLKQHPLFNASLDEAAGELVLKDYCHFGIAVDTEAGLLVPVIRDVDKKPLAQLAKELADLAVRARERKILPDEMKGGTFTVSNQGAIGSGHFTPIVNKPEVAILGVGRTALKPVALKDGKIEARPLMPLALSYDHRVIDGGGAARFMVDLVKALQEFSEAEVKL